MQCFALFIDIDKVGRSFLLHRILGYTENILSFLINYHDDSILSYRECIRIHRIKGRINCTVFCLKSLILCLVNNLRHHLGPHAIYDCIDILRLLNGALINKFRPQLLL